MPGARSPELMDLTSPECRPELGGAAPVLPAPAPCLSSPCPPPKAGSRRQAWAFTNTTVLDPHSNFIRRSFLKPSPHFAGGKSDAQRSLITFLKSHSQEAVELPSPASGWRAGSRMPGQRPCAAQPWDGALQRRGSGRGGGARRLSRPQSMALHCSTPFSAGPASAGPGLVGPHQFPQLSYTFPRMSCFRMCIS